MSAKGPIGAPVEEGHLRTSDGVDLHLQAWSVTEPRLTVALVHGYGEHVGRYRHLARALNDAGLSMLGIDLRGEGRSPGRRGLVEAFTDYHADVDALLDAARARAENGGVALMGHSMGGLIACDWLLARGQAGLRGLVLSSPLLGLHGNRGAAARLFLDVLSRLLPWCPLPAGLRGSQVTRDPAMAQAYDTDPYNHRRATARWVVEALEAIERVQAGVRDLELPTLLLYGGADRVVNPDATDRFATGLAMADRSVERLAGYYHEILNEPEAERRAVLERIVEWLSARGGG